MSATYELTITRLINAPPEKVYQAWIDPEMIKEWFCPRPWRVAGHGTGRHGLVWDV